MYNPPSTKNQLLRQVLIYAAMTLAVITLVFALILIMLGYRFNRNDGSIQQGGLVQFGSIPAGANVTLDDLRLSSITPSKLTITTGSHTITMTRDGYLPWRKAVEVIAGDVLWLNYARLIPTDLTVSNVADFSVITSSLASPNRKWLALTTDPSSRSITLIDTNAEKPKPTTLTLPEGSYTTPNDPKDENFQLMSWDSSNRYLLIKHIFAEGSEWIMADTQNIADSVNITGQFDVAISGLRFGGGSRELYALIDGDIRKIDVDGATMTAPLVKGVVEFSLFDRSKIAYVTFPDATTKRRTVGYFEEGAASPRTIRTYSDDATFPLHLSIGKYYGETYVAVAHGETVDIFKGPLPRSDSVDASSLATVATMTVPTGVDFLSNKTDGRFFVAQHDTSYSVYDLELNKMYTTALTGSSPLEGELRWLDGYTVWSSLDGKLRLYDFDGANQHEIMPILPGQNPTLSQNGQYLYAASKDEKGVYHVSRVRLILE